MKKVREKREREKKASMLFLGQWDSNASAGYSLNEENYDGYFF